jgi:hypothetical protein
VQDLQTESLHLEYFVLQLDLLLESSSEVVWLVSLSPGVCTSRGTLPLTRDALLVSVHAGHAWLYGEVA